MRHLFLLAFAITAIVGGARAQLIPNGSFETNNLSGGEGYRLLGNGDSTTIPGWTVLNNGNGGELPYSMRRDGSASDPYAIQDGDFAFNLNAGTGLTTTLNVTAGRVYAVSFYAQRYMTATALRVSFGDEDHSITVDRDYSASDPYNFVRYTTLFTTDTTGTLALTFFNPSTADYQQYYLDNVSVTAVPESAAAGLLLGCGALALIAVRRRSS